MKTYCYIVNNEIQIGPCSLPVNWNNTSNFYLLNDDELKSHGWLPYEVISENKPVFVRSTIDITDSKVIETIRTREKTQQELLSDDEQLFTSKWIEVRGTRNYMLSQSDSLVAIDRWEQYSEDRKQSIRMYRQALRELPQNFSDPFQISWPTLDNE